MNNLHMPVEHQRRKPRYMRVCQRIDISVTRMVGKKKKESANCDENCFQVSNAVSVRSRS